MSFQPPEQFNIVDYFLDDRIREGRGSRVALVTDQGEFTYEQVHALANRYANLLRTAGVEPEQRVVLALADGADYVGALFGILKIGAVVVMVNPDLKPDAVEYFFGYTRAVAGFVAAESYPAFAEAAGGLALKALFAVGTPEFTRQIANVPVHADTFPTHRDDQAIWLFSGGTTGRPKAVLQTHTSYANTCECYGKQVIRYAEDDIVLSVPKLFFGYATGCAIFFPFSVGAKSVLFAGRCTPEVLFEQIARHRPTILVNVPTMVNHMIRHPSALEQDLSSIRLATSAGEALPEELYRNWRETFGVELLDGLGTAEMWHIFISSRPGAVRPGTIGQVVPGFEVQVWDDEGKPLADGEVGWLAVRGNSRALGYWHEMEKTKAAFRGEWYVSGDMVRRDADGYFTYCGRGDDMLKVAGKWLSPQEVENCLLTHENVAEVAVVGLVDASGLTKPHAFVIPNHSPDNLAEMLRSWVAERLEGYKVPRTITLVDSFPRTHLGKVDRGKLKEMLQGSDR